MGLVVSGVSGVRGQLIEFSQGPWLTPESQVCGKSGKLLRQHLKEAEIVKTAPTRTPRRSA